MIDRETYDREMKRIGDEIATLTEQLCATAPDDLALVKARLQELTNEMNELLANRPPIN